MARRGGLAADPKFKLASDDAGLKAQRASILKRLQASGGKARNPQLASQLQQIDVAAKKMRATPVQTQQTPAGEQPATYESVNQNALGGMDMYMDQMQQNGAFNPGTFDDQFNKAYDTTMNRFERRMNPQFSQQREDFDQRMAERGISAGNEAYNREFQNFQQSQEDARLNAMDQAYNTGMAAQNQAYGQAANTYQMPAQMLGAYSPFYAGQTNQMMQNDAQAHELDAMKRQFGYNMKLQAAAPRGGGGGGGGMSMADRFALMDREMYNQMVMQGMQNTQGGQQQGNPYTNGILNGVATGTTAAIGSMLK